MSELSEFERLFLFFGTAWLIVFFVIPWIVTIGFALFGDKKL